MSEEERGLELQRAIGNQAVMRLQQQQVAPKPLPSAAGARVLHRKCACGAEPGPTGECDACRAKRRSLQTKHRIGAPRDVYEQEADRIADQVMQRPVHPRVRHAPLRIQRISGQPVGSIDMAPPSVHAALASPGRPLEPPLRQQMERRFGYDFSRVRVHSDALAERSARDVNAPAYTVGHDIVFGAMQFAPATPVGGRLLAHELTHVVQQRSGPKLQRQPADPGGGPQEGAGKAWPPLPARRGEHELKPEGRGVAIEYALAVTPGRFVETPEKSVALLRYERTVRIRTKSGHEAILNVQGSTAFLPPFDPGKSDFQQLNMPGRVSLNWDVSVKYSKAILYREGFDIAADLTRWHTAPKGTWRGVDHPRSRAELKSLVQFAADQPRFVHFYLSRDQQQQALEDFVEESAATEVPALRKKFEEGKKKYPPLERTQPAPSVEPSAKPKPQPPKELDDAALAHMTEDQRFDLAREKIWEGTKSNLRHMWQHPGETLKGFGKSLALLDTPEVFNAIGENLTEVLDSDANPWARAAAGVEAASKLSGWLGALAFALGAILTVVAFATGVGEVVAAIAAVTGLVLGAASLALHGGSSVLRAKAASQAKTAAEFQRNVDAGAGDLANGIAGVAVIVAGAIVHATTKAFPKTGQNIKAYLDDLGKRMRGARSAGAGAPQAAASEPGAPTKTKPGKPPAGAAPKPAGIIESLLDQLEKAFGPRTVPAGGVGDVPVPAPGAIESRSVPPKRTSPATVQDLRPPATGDAPTTEGATPGSVGSRQISKAEFDRLPYAERQKILDDWMKRHGVTRIIDSNDHHAWPKYLGGPEDGPLIGLDEQFHRAFHSALDKELPRNPRDRAPNETSTEYYARLPEARKIQNIKILKKVAKDFDLDWGTKIYDRLMVALKGTPYAGLP